MSKEPRPTSCICITSQELLFQATQNLFSWKGKGCFPCSFQGKNVITLTAGTLPPYPVLVPHPASCLPSILWMKCEVSSLFTHVNSRQKTAVWTLASLIRVSLRLCSLPPDQRRASQENPKEPLSAHTSSELCCLPADKVTGSFWPILNMKTVFWFFIEVHLIYHCC